MNFKTLRLSAAALAIVCGLSDAAAQTEEMFQYNGIWYNIPAEGAEQVSMTRPADFSYTGAIELASTVEYEGTTYKVNGYTSPGLFQNGTVSNLTIGEGFEMLNINFSVNDSESLEKVTLKSFFEPNYGSVSGRVSFGNPKNAICLYMRRYDDRSEMILHKFEVYGPDGNKLTPFVTVSDDLDNRIYPDADGVFAFGPNFTSDGNFASILSSSSSYIVTLFVEYEGKYLSLRIDPALDQTGISTIEGGLLYSIASDHAIVSKNNTCAGDIVIPESITYNGREYPVTEIAVKAFSNSAITSVVLPSSVSNGIREEAFSECTSLTRADLSAISHAQYGWYIFSDCPSLTEVKLPYAQQYIGSGMFWNCTSLTSIDIPATVTSINSFSFRNTGITEFTFPDGLEYIGTNAFTECALSRVCLPQIHNITSPFTDCGMVSLQVIENTDEYVKFRTDAEIYNADGSRKLPLRAYIYKNNFYEDFTALGEYFDAIDGVYTVPKEYLYSNYRKIAYQGLIYIYYDNNLGDYFEPVDFSEQFTPSFYTVTLPETGTSSVENAVIVSPEAPVEVYDLRGIRRNPDNLAPGMYIRRQGTEVSKFIVR